MTIENRPAVKVVVAGTVMLSFISFWHAAAIVLSDLASSAYYVGGIAESAIGKSAPWFILSIMLFSYAVRAIYIESCSHVRARRRVQSGARGHGRHAGQVLGVGADVRLRADRADQRRQRGPVSRRPDQRDRRTPEHPGHARERAVFRGGVRDRRSPFTSGARTSSASTNPARRPCASCRSPR